MSSNKHGNFSNGNLSEGSIIGIAFVRKGNTGDLDKDLIRTKLGTYTNHSDDPNLDIVKDGNIYVFKANCNIGKDVELTVNYNEFDFGGRKDFVFPDAPNNRNAEVTFSLHSFRKHGQPKLPKPKELRGIAPIFSIDYIPKKCRCRVFVKDVDVWVKHRDYFSPPLKVDAEDLGKPLGYLANKYLDKKTAGKFVYEDAWGAIVLRQEAWVRVNNLVNRVITAKNGFSLSLIWDEIRSQQEKYHKFKPFELCCTDMERFWENVVMKLCCNEAERNPAR